MNYHKKPEKSEKEIDNLLLNHYNEILKAQIRRRNKDIINIRKKLDEVLDEKDILQQQIDYMVTKHPSLKEFTQPSPHYCPTDHTLINALNRYYRSTDTMFVV